MPADGPTGDRVATTGRLPFSPSPSDLGRRSEEILAAARRRLDDLLGAAGPRTVERFLQPLDLILLDVRNLSSHTGLLFQVHPDPAAREAARIASEAADRFFNEFRLNDRVYHALGEIDLAGEDEVTRLAHAKLRREMRRAGVERPPEERARIIALATVSYTHLTLPTKA